MGRSARDLLTALLAGEADPALLAELARGRMRAKRDLLAQALQGDLKSHHRFLLAEQLADIDTLDEAIGHMSLEIDERLRPSEHQLRRLETIPGIKRRLAEVILASWAGMCPGNHESGGKRLSGRTRKGSPWLRSALVEAAHAAMHAKDSYLSAHYQRLVIRRGGKKATITVGHPLLVIIYYILSEDKDDEELGGHSFDEWDRQAVQKRLVRRLEKLGYEVKLGPTSLAM